MKIAYFDCFSGIAGDMALAALLDCGAPLDELKQALASLPVQGWDIQSEAVLRSGIHAQSVSITLDGTSDEAELLAARAHEAKHDHHHKHDHEHSHDEHDHDHHHEHSQSHAPHHHGRSMREIRALIEASDLNANVQSKALAIFEKIAVAEAYLHHSTPEEIHFHEIGGLDSLLDIVGVAWCLDWLGVDEIVCSALPHSTGFVDCAHGRMPVPAPATLEILKGAPWTPTDLRGELVTPTGAGIVGALASGFGAMPALTLERIGLGAGKKQLRDRPNILRISIGETASSTKPDGLEWTTLTLLETNVDDMNPQLWEATIDSLFAAGALDVWTIPIAMKKGRPAQKLSVLCESEIQTAVLRAILRETTTLGVRVQTVQRASLPREMSAVSTQWGEVRVKIASWDEGGISRAHPEWDDVKKLAQQFDVPAREVYAQALQLANETK